MITNEEIEKKLLKTATDPQYSAVLKEYAEIGVDAVFENEIIDAIPVVKSISALLKGVVTIQDRIFLKKLAHFLVEANKLSIEERDAWYAKHIKGKQDVETELADKLMIIVNAVNDEFKAGVIGKIFRAFVKGEIDKLEDFYYMIELAEGCFTKILRALAEGKEMTDEALFRTGIKHASNITGQDITEMLGRDNRLAYKGTSSSNALPYRNADYTAAGKLLIKILKEN